MIDKDKIAAMAAGSTQQAKPTAGKTLGDVIAEALKRATAEREVAAQQCQCEVCAAKREAEAEATCGMTESTMVIGSPSIRGIGDEVEAQLETLVDEDAYVIALAGEGVDFVEHDNGNKGIRFNSSKALSEFFDFIKGVSDEHY